MKAQYFKDKQFRTSFKKNEMKRQFLKRLARNEKLNSNERWMAQIQLDRFSKKRSAVRVRNRCVLTFRGRGLEKNLKISRIEFRNKSSNGLVPGLKKSIW